MDYYAAWLAHHGIKGQKWGVRRYQNEDGSLTALGKKHAYIDKSGRAVLVKDEALRKDNAKKFDKYLKEERSKLKIAQKTEEAIAFGKKHGLDLDDGGGGSPSAGRKYLKMWDDIEDLGGLAYDSATKRAAESMIKKYGPELYDNFKKRDIRRSNRRSNARAAAILTGLLAPIAVPVAAVALYRHAKK